MGIDFSSGSGAAGSASGGAAAPPWQTSGADGEAELEQAHDLEAPAAAPPDLLPKPERMSAPGGGGGGADEPPPRPKTKPLLDPKSAYRLGWEAAMRAARGEEAAEGAAAEGAAGEVAEDLGQGAEAVLGLDHQSALHSNVGERPDNEAGLRPEVEVESQEAAAGLPEGGADDAERTVLDWAVDQAQFADLPELQPGWIRIRSKTSNRIYFLNTVSGKTTFTEPTLLPPGWTQVKSRSTGTTYYWNAELNQSTFELPTA